MDSAQFAQQAQQLANDVLVWVGFGTIVGLLAKAIMPGRDPGGAVATLLMGVGGTVIGCSCVSYFCGYRLTPISILGLIAATAGAFLLLLFYRMLGGRFFVEDGTTLRRQVRQPVYRTRRPAVEYVED
ncbi:MAG: GlsB/YeaQ/YmgE family stress response membrane protein [Pirellulales bacterium]|nr:GlsB/YeaQ/YmgE family stress response membrane protein [Pirellulales bacterium]